MTRLERIQARLSDDNLDAILLINPKNRRYATSFPSSEGTVLVTKKEAFCFVDSRYIEAARAHVKGATIGQTSAKMRLRDWLEQAIRDCSVTRLGFEEDYLPYSDYTRFRDMLPQCELVPAAAICSDLRAAKDEAELASMIKAQEITDKVFEELLSIIHIGMTEREIAAEITYRHLKNGAEGDSFPPIVVAGKNSSMPHGVPGDYVVSDGDFITMDFGCVKDGYCSDMTRTVALGHVSEEMERVYSTVLEAQRVGIKAARAGIVGSEIDKAARDVIETAGFGQYFGHSFGHSLGLDIHESPSASPSEKRIMPVGAVVSAEPGIYLPSKFGVRIEDVLYLRENDCVNLTKAPKNLIIL